MTSQQIALLKQALATDGAVAMAMDVGCGAFRSYRSGVMTSCCTGSGKPHAMTLVGYGTEGGREYWLIMNSWGSRWGSGGKFKLSTSCAMGTVEATRISPGDYKRVLEKSTEDREEGSGDGSQHIVTG